MSTAGKSRILGLMARAIAVGLLGASLAACSSTSKAKTLPPIHYYVALGDSLSVGWQPHPSTGKGYRSRQGYTNDLYSYLVKKIPGLKLVEFGCPGETTKTMVNGGICHYKDGSQLKQADSFLTAHQKSLSLVTIDIGANDIDNCGNVPASQVGTCALTGMDKIKTQLPQILSSIRAAAGPKVTMVGMTLYDPFLARWLDGSSGQSLARLSVGVLKTLNTELTNEYKKYGLLTAHIGTAFSSYVPFTQTKTLSLHDKFAKYPVAVAQVCVYTWMCVPPPAGPDIHANFEGYKMIAQAFETALKHSQL
ncbi:MAG: SGNH/GDSL hydrolase family protein [Actinobacteria bacterium]|nr:SGNH/GDSL hydrolase family protein [Actinomycetota bacterium]MCL5446010.1 SGNH/GDSL hydrolase family protein [Actinomycetota bacterium]